MKSIDCCSATWYRGASAIGEDSVFAQQSQKERSKSIGLRHSICRCRLGTKMRPRARTGCAEQAVGLSLPRHAPRHLVAARFAGAQAHAQTFVRYPKTRPQHARASVRIASEVVRSGPIPKFASFCGTLACELRNQGPLAIFMSLVPRSSRLNSRHDVRELRVGALDHRAAGKPREICWRTAHALRRREATTCGRRCAPAVQLVR
jgi:hypothetical protein